MKNKIQSYVGMRGACGWLNDPLITHLSPTYHPLKHGIGKYIFSFLLVLAMSIGQMWAADPTHESPSIVEKANRTFLNLAGTPSNVTVSTDFYSNYGPGYFISNKGADLSASWWSFTGTFKSSSSSYSNVSGAVGFHDVGSSSSSEFYQILQMRTGSGRMTQMDFYVTGTTQMGFQWKNGGTSGKYLTFSIYEMDVTGATATDGASPVSTVQGTTTSSSDQYAASATLDGSKYYHVVVTPLNTSNINFYGLTFKHAPAASHTVTYKSGWNEDLFVVDTDAKKVANCPAAFAYSGYDFAGWKDGDNNDVEVGATVTSDMTLTAQWTVHVAKYTVKYMDGTTEVGSETVEVGQHPAGSAISAPTKDCYTFDAWSPALSTVSGSDGDVVNVNATWTPVYSSSATLISDANVSAKANVNTVFAASNIVSSITFTSGNYEFTSNETKPGYYGYKDKNSGDYMKILLKQGKRAQVLFGNLGADPTITVNGVAKSLDAARATGDMAENTFTWTAAEDALIVITMGSGTNTLKKVDIVQLYTATRVDGKSDGAGSDANVLETTLPTPTAISGWTFTGWTANEDVKAGGDTKTAGTVLAAGTYTLLANTTFTAQWAEASSTYDITYVSAHGTAPDAENAASVVLAELSADGWAHKGWTANADVTVDAATIEAGTLIANGKTAIFESNVTFTAVWKEIFTVTFDSKGGSAVDPIDVEDGASIAAAPADPTKDDYVFQGWSETDGGAVVADITALTISGDKTLYASWALDVQVSEIVFSNSFKGWIVGSTVTVFYMAGESAPTITSYAGKNLKAEGGVVISGDKIIATGTDDSEIEFALTMTEVTPLTATGTQTFDGTESYVKTRHAWTSDKKWKLSKYATDGRVARGETSLYIFLGAAESVTLDWGAQKVTDDVAVYVNGTFVKNVGKNNNSAIELSNGNNMVALYSLQTSGDIWLNGLTVAPWVPVTGVTLKEGEDPISSKEIWETTSFTLTAEVTPDNASNKTITWTTSNEAVATVADGVVTGVAANASPVTITASTVDGVTATCEVTVTAAPEPSADPVITAQPASANYYEGATIAALEVVATGESLTYQWYLGSDPIDGATNATYTPTVTAIGSYVYHCVVTNSEAGKLPTSLASINATITIADDPAAIKLLDSEGEINTTNFTTGVSKGTVTISEVSHNCASFGSTGGSIVGLTGLNKVVAYNATTTQTKVKFVLYNTNSSAKELYLQKVLEGATEAVTETISVPSKELFETQYYTYNSSNLRSFYVTVNSTNIKILQVKVIESGTALKRAGESGYELNLNLGRVFGAQGEATTFEGLAFAPSSNAKVLNSTELPITTPLSFTIAAPLTLKVTTSAAKYYVSQNSAEDGTTATAMTETGEKEFDLTVAGTWYIVPSTTSAVKLTNLAFTAPKCEQPTVVDMESIGLCEGDAFIALTVSASVSDEGTLHYAWFKEAGATDEAVGTDAASFTPEADGEYYVIVTNQKTGYSDNSETSNTVSVEHFAAAVITTAPADVAKEVGQEATLSVVATGKNCTYEWFTCDDALGTNPVAIVPAETEASLTVTVAAGEQYYMVVVSSDCGAPVSAVAKVAEWRELTPANVTGSVTWDWTSAAWNGITGDIAFANTGVEELMANVNAKVPCVDGFRSDMLYGTGQYVWRSGNKFFQGTKIRFITTVPGKLVVRYRNTSGNTNTRTIKITNNGEALPADGTNTTNSFKNTNPVVVKAGEVIIEGIASEENGLTRIEKIIFDADLDPTQAEEATLGGYERDVTEGRYGTICLPKAGIMVGAAIFELAYYSESDNKIFMDQVMSGEMVAGRPYIFLPNEGVSTLGVYYTDDEAVAAGDYRGLYGYYDGTDNAMQLDPGDGHYILYNNQFREVTVSHVWIDQNRAYFKIGVAGGIPTNVVAPLPGRRRMSIGAAAPQVTTGMDELNAGEAPVKVLINGELFILRGDKMFDATGRLIK